MNVRWAAVRDCHPIVPRRKEVQPVLALSASLHGARQSGLLVLGSYLGTYNKSALSILHAADDTTCDLLRTQAWSKGS
jgi:hypothetical protein